MADMQIAMLLSMGYPKPYIDRAIDVHKKSKYGSNWNLSILVEIIVRLQEKDKQELQLYQMPQQNAYNNNHNAPQQYEEQNKPPLKLQQSRSFHNENKPYDGHLAMGLAPYKDDLSDSEEEMNANAMNPSPGDEKEEKFIPHYLSIEEPLSLCVNNYVDYRYENGRYLLCKIIAKSVELNNMMLLHPVGKPIYDTKYDRLVDIYQEYFKLSPAKSICLRKIKSSTHKLYSLQIGDYIDINPFCNGHTGWKNGKIIKLDANSSQIKAVYHNDEDDKNYSYWFHLLNATEVAVFRSKYEQPDRHQLDLEYQSRQTFGDVEDDYVIVDDNPMKDEHKYEEKQEEKQEDIILYDDEDDDILTKNIYCNEVKDDEICQYLLNFDESKWEFNTNSVEIYRLQCNEINHALMLPHPLDIQFPQYFSSSTIPAKTQFFANVLPPTNKEKFPTRCKRWKIQVVVKETTATVLISNMVKKLQNSLMNLKETYKEDEFMLKVVGCEEYMLYEENRLIIDYEAVRKAVRNEDNVIFQLLHCPTLKQMERECFNMNMHHISKYKSKYIDTGLLSRKIMRKHENMASLKYCKYSYGDGTSLTDESQHAVVDSFDIELSEFAAEQFDDDKDEERSVLSHIPSMKDTKHLLNTVIENEEEIFFHTFDEYYSIKILFLVNATQFPLYKHYVKKKNTHKWCIVIRHELWIADLKYDKSTFDTDHKHSISDGMRFGDSACFESSKQKYCDLARESCISFTVYLIHIDRKEQEIPIAFVRFPLISESNLLRKGKYSLNLWPIPVFIAYYKGPKCDAYNNLSFRYRGPTVDRHLKRFKIGGKNELQNVFKLGIEFSTNNNKKLNKKCKIIALPLNYKWDYKKGTNVKHDSIERAQQLAMNTDLLHDYNEEEKHIIWKHRDYLCKYANTFTAFIRCVDFRDRKQRSECYDYISKWSLNSKLRLEDYMELLSYEYMDTFVRELCVLRIAAMDDCVLQIYLLQLVQCLKYELHHNNALIRLLMRRALNNPNQIGHYLFWHLKSEYLSQTEVQLHYIERIALYLEEYLLFARPSVARDILCESNLSRCLMVINNKLRRLKKENKSDKTTLNEIMYRDLSRLNKILPSSFVLPISPKYKCTGIIIDECKLMSSAQMPLWLTLCNVDDSDDSMPIRVIFKAGDDLRQDILTLSILRVFDRIWLDRGLNLNLLPYHVVSTGNGQGMVEIVTCARTTTYIHTKYGGGAQKGARDQSTHLKYLRDVHKDAADSDAIMRAIDIYTRSCAGYCIASYVLGLGDRHPSNIMVRNKGELFHIDFSHFLGNFKSQKVIGDYVKWQREVAPFVFLPSNKYCIENGGDDASKYNEFVQFAVNAYISLRQRHKLLINLFILMLPSQMPELIIKDHIAYLKDQLHLDDIENHDVHKHITKIINICLNDKRRIMDNMIHAMVHQ